MKGNFKASGCVITNKNGRVDVKNEIKKTEN